MKEKKNNETKKTISGFKTTIAWFFFKPPTTDTLVQFFKDLLSRKIFRTKRMLYWKTTYE